MSIFLERADTEVTMSPSLGIWLQENRVSLAMTCYQTGQLMFIGTKNNGEVIISESNYGHVMGLTRDSDNGLIISTFDQIVRFSSTQEVTGAAGEGQTGIIFTPTHVKEVGDIDIHEMDINKANELLFVNTCYSCISKPSDIGAFEPVWHPNFISELKPEHRCHLNGMCLIGGELRFVTAISNANEPDGWRGKRTKTGVMVDTVANEIVIGGISMPHSPRFYDGSLWLLESGKGHIQIVNPKDFSRQDVAFCPGFLRGLSFHDKFAIAGMSLGRDDGFEGLDIDGPLKAKSIKPQCGIDIVNIQTGKTDAWIRFNGKIRELFSIAVLTDAMQARSLELPVSGHNSGGLDLTRQP